MSVPPAAFTFSIFEVLRDGLPQEHAYDLVYRHALDVDGIAALNGLIKEHAARGGCVLLTSHQALTLADPAPQTLDLEHYAPAPPNAPAAGPPATPPPVAPPAAPAAARVR